MEPALLVIRNSIIAMEFKNVFWSINSNGHISSVNVNGNRISKIHPPSLFTDTDRQSGDCTGLMYVFFFYRSFNCYINCFFHLAIYTSVIHSRITVFVASLFK